MNIFSFVENENGVDAGAYLQPGCDTGKTIRRAITQEDLAQFQVLIALVEDNEWSGSTTYDRYKIVSQGDTLIGNLDVQHLDTVRTIFRKEYLGE